MPTKQPFPPLEAMLLPLLARADRQAFQWLEHKLTPHGISLADFRIVGALLGEEQGVNQKVLAARLGLEPATISVAIGKLETAGHVERTTDPDDARARRVKLKKKGAGLGHVLRILEELESTALAGISDKDLATARRVLNRISENLNQPSSQGATS